MTHLNTMAVDIKPVVDLLSFVFISWLGIGASWVAFLLKAFLWHLTPLLSSFVIHALALETIPKGILHGRYQVG